MNFLRVAEGAVYAFLFWQSKVLCRVEWYLEVKKCFSLIRVTLLDLSASYPGERRLIMISAFPEWIPLLVFDALCIMIRIMDHKSSTRSSQRNAHPKIKLVPWQDFLGVQTSEFPNPFNAAICSYGKKRFWCKPLHNSVNKPFYTCLFSDMAFEWQRSWRWPCFDRHRCFCCNISKTSASVSSGVPNTEKVMKARGRRPSAFIVSRCL